VGQTPNVPALSGPGQMYFSTFGSAFSVLKSDECFYDSGMKYRFTQFFWV